MCLLVTRSGTERMSTLFLKECHHSKMEVRMHFLFDYRKATGYTLQIIYVLYLLNIYAVQLD